MLEIKLNFENDILKRVALISPSILKNINHVVKQAAFLIRNTAVKKIQHGDRTGRLYLRYRGGKNPIAHRASAPGEPPKTDTGRLVASIRTNFYDLTAEVGSDVKYSAFLETGTSKMKPRPWLAISRDENNSKIDTLIDKAINDALK